MSVLDPNPKSPTGNPYPPGTPGNPTPPVPAVEHPIELTQPIEDKPDKDDL